MTHTQLLRDAIPRAEELHRGLRELSSRLGSAVGAAAMDAETAASELVRRLRFGLREYEKWEALGDDLECLDEDAQSGPYRTVGMSDACVTLHMPDGTAVEGVGRTMGEADVDARRRASGCCGSLFAGLEIQAFDLVLPDVPAQWDGPWRRVPSSGCYKASFGWVHTRPACRCVR